MCRPQGGWVSGTVKLAHALGGQGSRGHRSLVPCSGSTALPAEHPAPTGVPGLPSPARGQHRIKKT